jgi:hypothetical protein
MDNQMSLFAPNSINDDLNRAVAAARLTFGVRPEPDGRWAVGRTLPAGVFSVITSCRSEETAREAASAANEREAASALRRWSEALDPIDRPIIAEFYSGDNP